MIIFFGWMVLVGAGYVRYMLADEPKAPHYAIARTALGATTIGIMMICDSIVYAFIELVQVCL
jgi:hypothetical protein